MSKKNHHHPLASWIWICKERWPEVQICPLTLECGAIPGQRFGVAEFHRKYVFSKPIASLSLQVSGDTKFWLTLNGQFIGQGPVCVGGDFGPAIKPDRYFINSYQVDRPGKELDFFAKVQLSAAVLLDLSCGQGGFYLKALVQFEDGETITLGTDHSWMGRLASAHLSPTQSDFRLPQAAWAPVMIQQDIWQAEVAELPMLAEENITSPGSDSLQVPGGTEQSLLLEFDRIYSGYVTLQVQTREDLEIKVEISETHRLPVFEESLITDHDLHYRSLRMHSIGRMHIRAKNHGTQSASITKIGLVFTHYPIFQEGSFSCSDPDLNRIYEVCKWTLQICRQSIHLDSPLHQELLACTGDYYIESLMNYCTFGDTRLTRMDLIRTGDRLLLMDGKMFHTTYSLIWVQMMFDYYLFTADKDTLSALLAPLHILLARFQGYLGGQGVLDHAPDYMFVDWTVIDGFTMHHPPKALGQTSLNAFYYNALCRASQICRIAGDAMHATYENRAKALKSAFVAAFWDEQRGLFFEGFNGQTPTHRWLPQNPDKRYFTKYGNTLAVLYNLVDARKGKNIMKKVLADPALPDVQPYFMHFILEALHQTGLFEKEGMPLLLRWKTMVDECDKGLKEGWFPPEEGYQFDYSHAWGGTPAYQLPMRLLGFEMLEPGFGKIRLSPRLLGLQQADISIPTPLGMLSCRLVKGQKPAVSLPEGMICECDDGPMA